MSSPFDQNPQCANRVLMIRPTRFVYDPEAADTNRFMVNPEGVDSGEIGVKAQREFDGVVAALEDAGVQVCVFEDDLGLPDSVFPNNWISFHDSGSSGDACCVLYPMLTQARRRERRPEILEFLRQEHGALIQQLDLSSYESEGLALEGTGALVLDRVHKIAYACRSTRMNESVLRQWCSATGFAAAIFDSVDQNGCEIYHTNVVLSVGEEIVLCCFESIRDEKQRDMLRDSFRSSGKRVLELTLDQVGSFCANAMELHNRDGQSVWAMSDAAWNGFTSEQQGIISERSIVVHPPIPTIELVGGGSVRCMIAEFGVRNR